MGAHGPSKASIPVRIGDAASHGSRSPAGRVHGPLPPTLISSRGNSNSMRRCYTCHKRTENPRFCSRRCAAITNNRLFPKRLPEGRCSRCAKPLTTHRGICDVCKARSNRWFVGSPVLGSVLRPENRMFVLDLVGLGLWWGEGRKDRYYVSVVNADPDAILLFIKWLREVYRVPLRKFRIAVSIHRDLDLERTLRFWRRLTGIPRRQFYPAQIFPDRGTKNRTFTRLAYGVCSVSVFDVRLHDSIQWRLEQVRSLARISDSGYPLRRLLPSQRSPARGSSYD